MKIFSTLLLLLCCLVLTSRAQENIPLPGAGITALHSGTTLLAATYNDGIAVVAPMSHSIVKTLKTSESITALAWSPDGKSLIFGCKDGSVRLWNMGAVTAQAFASAQAAVTALAWSTDGKQIVVGTAAGILEQRDGKGKTIRILKGHTVGISCVAWTKKEIRSVDANGTLIRWNNTTGTSFSVFALPRPVITAAWSPDGALLLVAGTDSTVIRNILTGAQTRLATFAKVEVRAASWNPEASLVTTLDNNGEITVWEAFSGTPFLYANSVRVSNAQSLVMIDGQHIAITNTKDIILYDLTMVTDVPGLLAAMPTLRVYPNPMRQDGVAELSIAVPTHIRLSITDMQGREIAIFCNERLPANTYTYRCSNFMTTPGIYLLHMVTPQSQITMPLLFVR